MDLKLHSKEYTQWHEPLETVIDFFKGKLSALGWDRCESDEMVMDVGCGPGGTTKEVILPFFFNVKKIVAMDLMPDMINIAKSKNAHPRIEYVVADIEDWSFIQKWEEKLSKVISIHCFHWVKNQIIGFQNIYRLLKSGGEAAFFFVLEGTFFDVVKALQNNPRWMPYIKDRDNKIPDSHHYKHGANYYKNLLECIGFEVLHCKVEEKIDLYPSEDAIKNFFSSLCVLSPYIPEEHMKDFKNDLVQELIKKNGRTYKGFPLHRGKILELVVRKK